MNKGIPFIKIADHVDVNFHLKARENVSIYQLIRQYFP